MRAIDTPIDTQGRAEQLAAAGIQAVAFYARVDRASKRMVMDLAKHGIKRISVFERGKPTAVKYFTAVQGAKDAHAAVAFAKLIGQPCGTQIFFAVDYDAAITDVRAISDYFKAAQFVAKASGYLCSVYGSGLVCRKLIDQGFAHSGWLAQSHGWAGYDAFISRAAIIQGKEDQVFGLDIDWDTVFDSAVCW